MTEYERMLRHRALWIWLAETGQWKGGWPGWKVLQSETTSGKCFLCPCDDDKDETCDGGRSIYCTEETDASCLNNAYFKSTDIHAKLQLNNSWINRRAFELACYRIAFVPWKVKPEPDVGVYMETLKSLEKAYGGHPVRFVPADIRDYNRFIGEWRN